ncbi:sialoadhesin [Thalassophryne amazonica]|uniref:sialoadhesin n=1 Tax=Thalassophryne amazonica TaxID=390379 RepID=UPI0014721F3D|nr:sialoadhesin [Thalassophryne amazonica]
MSNVKSILSTWIMKILVGLLSLLITVTGDEEVTVDAVLGQSVLLPCNCSSRSLVKNVMWQMEKPNLMMVAKYGKEFSKFYGRYDGRAEIFQAENSENCSVLLTNIQQEDQGKYRCSFYIREAYKYILVHLWVTEFPRITGTASPQTTHLRPFIAIPFVLTVGICLVLFYCYFSKRRAKMKGAVTHDRQKQLNTQDEAKNMINV